MSDMMLHSNEDDSEVTRGLRRLYAAPTADSYWSELESRIMLRVADVELGWWVELDKWVRPALAAAAVLILAAGVAMFRARQDTDAIAYESLLTPTPAPVATAVRPALQDDGEAVMRFLFGR